MTKKKAPEDLEQRGRPTEMTPEKILLLEQAFSLGCSDLEACLHADIGKTTLYNFQKKHPEFVERKAMLKDKLVLKARTVIADALNKKDKEMAKWYLEKKKKNEFGKDDSVNVSVTTQNNISIDEDLIRSMNEEIRKDD